MLIFCIFVVNITRTNPKFSYYLAVFYFLYLYYWYSGFLIVNLHTGYICFGIFVYLYFFAKNPYKCCPGKIYLDDYNHLLFLAHPISVEHPNQVAPSNLLFLDALPSHSSLFARNRGYAHDLLPENQADTPISE